MFVTTYVHLTLHFLFPFLFFSHPPATPFIYTLSLHDALPISCAISVVTEEDFFQGDLGWVNKIRSSAGLPVLRKDFLWQPFQIYETRAAGASAVLLIVAMLEPGELKELLALSQQLKLEALVEVHDETE